MDQQQGNSLTHFYHQNIANFLDALFIPPAGRAPYRQIFTHIDGNFLFLMVSLIFYIGQVMAWLAGLGALTRSDLYLVSELV